MERYIRIFFEKAILKVNDRDVKSALKFVQDYTDTPTDVFINSIHKGKYENIKLNYLLQHSNVPYDNKRRPQADSRVNNTIILAHIRSSISKSTSDYYWIIDGNHRVIQYEKMNKDSINALIIEAPYIFISKTGKFIYDSDFK